MGLAESQTGWQLEVRAQTISDGNKIRSNRWKLCNSTRFLFGGCSFLSWYPITPSSSVTETFGHYANEYYKDSLGHNPFAIIQAEDELSTNLHGARSRLGWSSGCTLHLRTRDVPYGRSCWSVIFRRNSSCYMECSTSGAFHRSSNKNSAGDLISAYSLSHGDTEHIVLLPGSPGECFEMGQIAFDLSERLQTLVIVLSDLDIRMNYWRCDEFQYPTKDFDRGKVFAADIEKSRSV